jgi:hypothetical protein
VSASDEGLRDNDEHATKNGPMQALKNNRLSIGRILLQNLHRAQCTFPKCQSETAPEGAVSLVLENLKINAS